MNWINWLRSGSQLVAGLKITAAFLSYVGVGQIGKWLFETFYPFTRLLWGDFFRLLSLPEISNVEKDALTALLFFLPLGVSAIVSAIYDIDKENLSQMDKISDRRTASIFGMIFIFLICGSLIAGIQV